VILLYTYPTTLCSSFYIGGECSKHGKDEKTTNILVLKLVVEGELGRHRNRWEGCIKRDLVGIKYEYAECIHVAQSKDH
jgi:hypothetical protein